MNKTVSVGDTAVSLHTPVPTIFHEWGWVGGGSNLGNSKLKVPSTDQIFICKRGRQVRIQDLVKGGPQLLRPKVADVAKRSHMSKASNLQPGSRALKWALEAFGFLMLKYAFSHILETLFLSFLTSILTPKVDKNRTLEFTSINLRHSYILHLFFNLQEKVML